MLRLAQKLNLPKKPIGPTIANARNTPSGILIPGNPFYFNLLPGWLVNDAFPLLFTQDAIEEHTLSVTKFVPASEPEENNAPD